MWGLALVMVSKCQTKLARSLGRGPSQEAKAKEIPIYVWECMNTSKKKLIVWSGVQRQPSQGMVALNPTKSDFGLQCGAPICMSEMEPTPFRVPHRDMDPHGRGLSSLGATPILFLHLLHDLSSSLHRRCSNSHMTSIPTD